MYVEIYIRLESSFAVWFFSYFLDLMT
jgi:hypothetical protein